MSERYKQRETVQLWYCHTCDRVFTPQIAKGKTFPLKVILESLCLYYREETRQRVAARITERFGMRLSLRTLSQWLTESRELTTSTRLRSHALTLFTPTPSSVQPDSTISRSTCMVHGHFGVNQTNERRVS